MLDMNTEDTVKAEILVKINNWINTYSKQLTTNQKKYLSKMTDEENSKLQNFYSVMKIHKPPIDLLPITACCGGVLCRLGVIVDIHLQKVEKTFDSYIKNSTTFRRNTTQNNMKRGMAIWTADAKALYTNILTKTAIGIINQCLFFNSSKFPVFLVRTICKGLKFIMENNVFSFGDTLWQQVNGAAMGKPPNLSYSTIFFGIHELSMIPEMKKTWIPTILFLLPI